MSTDLLLLRPQITHPLQPHLSTPVNIIMDFLYVPTQYSSENYSSFVDNETANSVPGFSHSSDASSRCNTPNSFDRERDFALSDAVWNSLPSFEDPLHIGTETPQPTKQGGLELFGTRSDLHCASEDQQLLGSSFDSLMRGLEHQSYSDVFSYAAAYEPLNWASPSLQTAVDIWPDLSSSNRISISSLRPMRDDLNSDSLRSLDSYRYPTDAPTTSRTSSTSSPPNQGISSIRFNPLATRRDTPKGSATRSKDGDDAPVYQHVCSACLSKFARARDLARHFRLHTGERPYECSGCNERFIRVDARKRHWNSNPKCLAAHQNLNP